MTDLDLGNALRRLRRVADLSQRELAEKAGVPPSTVARIESAEVQNPQFRTIERLARAAGGAVTVEPGSADPHADATAVRPDEPIGDAAGRRFPAHLDVRETYPMIDERNQLLPPGTMVYRFERYRVFRDERRARMAPAAQVEIIASESVPGQAWSWTAQAGDEVVAELRAWMWPQQMAALGQLRELAMCQLAVRDGWRRVGIEQRLLRELRTVLAENDVAFAVTLGYARSDVAYLRSLGFHTPVPWLTTLRLAA